MSNARTKAYMVPVAGTAVATTSGTSFDFTGIPSWARRITIAFSGVSTSGAGGAALLLQIGSGSIENTGYLSSCGIVSGTNSAGSTTSTAGFLATTGLSGTTVVHGIVTLQWVSGNQWVSSGTLGATQAFSYSSGGNKTASGAIDRVRITTTNGTDAFDAGTVNILYE